MVNQDAIVHAREAIKGKIGSLHDLSPELANTVANIFYNDALFYFDFLDKVRTGPSIITAMNKGELKAFNNDRAYSLYMVAALPEQISNLRKLKTEDQRSYLYSIELLLDIYKYRIDRAHKKSLLIRRILRRFHRPTEIPNLNDLINDNTP